MSAARRKHIIPSASAGALSRTPRHSLILLIFILIAFLTFFPPPFISSHLSNTLSSLPPPLQRLPNPFYINSYVAHALNSAAPSTTSAVDKPTVARTGQPSFRKHASAKGVPHDPHLPHDGQKQDMGEGSDGVSQQGGDGDGSESESESERERERERESGDGDGDGDGNAGVGARPVLSNSETQSWRERSTVQNDLAAGEETRDSFVRGTDATERPVDNEATDAEPRNPGAEEDPVPETGGWKMNTTDVWQLPPALSEQLESASRDSPLAAQQTNHSWTQPLVISSYVRARTVARDDFDLFVYVTGVTMGNYKRSLSAPGCLIGDDVYPVQYAALEVFYCRVWRGVRAGERVSIVLRDDAALREALERPLELGDSGRTLTLEGDAVERLEKDVRLRLGSSGESQDIADYMAVRSDVVVSERLDPPAESAPRQTRYEICAATMMKQFPHLLRDWVDYHRRIGVDMVYLLDNAATEDIRAMFQGRGDVETLFWPWGRSQTQALSAVLIAARSRCEWLLLHDADEYIMLGVGEQGELAGRQPFRRLLRRKRAEGYADVQFRYITMGPSGHIHIPKVPPPEAYTELWWQQKKNGKTVSQTAREWRASKVHYNKPAEGTLIRRFHAKQTNMQPVREEDDAAVVHFQLRSMQEALLKSSFESASIGDMNLGPRKKADYALLERPPRMYRTPVPPERRYEHFRDVWRAITKAGDAPLHRQTLVREREGDGRRELREWDLQRNAWVDEDADTDADADTGSKTDVGAKDADSRSDNGV